MAAGAFDILNPTTAIQQDVGLVARPGSTTGDVEPIHRGAGDGCGLSVLEVLVVTTCRATTHRQVTTAVGNADWMVVGQILAEVGDDAAVHLRRCGCTSGTVSRSPSVTHG